MFVSDMTEVIKKLHVVMFGSQIEVVPSREPEGFKGFSVYLPANCQSGLFVTDPGLALVAAKLQKPVDQIVLFEECVNQAVSDGTFNRPHIKPITVIWSMAIKAVWEKVRVIHRENHPYRKFKDTILEPEEITLCLPEGHEFPDNFPHKSNAEIIEENWAREMSGYRTEFAMTPEQEDDGLLHYSVERAIISAVALRCKNETEMFEFLEQCRDLALNK